MATIADEIAARIARAAPAAYSLAAGYWVTHPGTTVSFPPGAQLSERRNESGRVTRALYAYADGSRLEFTWHPARGSNLRPHMPGRP